MLDLIRRIPNRTQRDAYVPELARLSGIDERTLRDELARGPRPTPVRLIGAGAAAEPRLSPLERQALTLLLLNPALAREVREGEPLPIRDQAGRSLAEAWRAAIAASADRPDLEAFVADLDPATADLARSVLASARARGVIADMESDREELRVCLLRLQVAEIEARLSDLQALIRANADDASNDIRHLERQFQELTRDREQLRQEIRGPALAAGERRS